MKKRSAIVVVCLATSLAMLLAACGATNSGASTPGHSSASSSNPASQSSPSPTSPQVVFTPGTWLSDRGQYYFFDDGETTGRTASLDNGSGVGFTYAVSGAEATFSMGAADNTSSCSVIADGDTITLEWADGTTEYLTYVSEQGSDTFQFYSNQELADLALTYYKENNNAQDNQNLTSAAQTNEDGSVSIQVYENLGDHNSTAAWYTVDRTTATGTDESGTEVDLAG